MKRHSPLQLVLWLGVALVAHFLVALFGVLNRWLQVGHATGSTAVACGQRPAKKALLGASDQTPGRAASSVPLQLEGAPAGAGGTYGSLFLLPAVAPHFPTPHPPPPADAARPPAARAAVSPLGQPAGAGQRGPGRRSLPDSGLPAAALPAAPPELRLCAALPRAAHASPEGWEQQQQERRGGRCSSRGARRRAQRCHTGCFAGRGGRQHGQPGRGCARARHDAFAGHVQRQHS